jgi:hypothetical protein
MGGIQCSLYENDSNAFGGALTLSILQMLVYASSQSNAGGGQWYANTLAVQSLALHAFMAIGNQTAFTQ